MCLENEAGDVFLINIGYNILIDSGSNYTLNLNNSHIQDNFCPIIYWYWAKIQFRDLLEGQFHQINFESDKFSNQEKKSCLKSSQQMPLIQFQKSKLIQGLNLNIQN